MHFNITVIKPRLLWDSMILNNNEAEVEATIHKDDQEEVYMKVNLPKYVQYSC